MDGDNVYELAIIASDGVNNSEDPFVLYVTILNENDNVPVMSEETAEVTVPENVDGTIYTAVASDDDTDGDPLEYILGGADAALFYLDPYTGELSFFILRISRRRSMTAGTTFMTSRSLRPMAKTRRCLSPCDRGS